MLASCKSVLCSLHLCLSLSLSLWICTLFFFSASTCFIPFSHFYFLFRSDFLRSVYALPTHHPLPRYPPSNKPTTSPIPCIMTRTYSAVLFIVDFYLFDTTSALSFCLVPYIVKQCSILSLHGSLFNPTPFFLFLFTYFYFLWLSSCVFATTTFVFHDW